jgi:hypothetical protein
MAHGDGVIAEATTNQEASVLSSSHPA